MWDTAPNRKLRGKSPIAHRLTDSEPSTCQWEVVDTKGIESTWCIGGPEKHLRVLPLSNGPPRATVLFHKLIKPNALSAGLGPTIMG